MLAEASTINRKSVSSRRDGTTTEVGRINSWPNPSDMNVKQRQTGGDLHVQEHPCPDRWVGSRRQAVEQAVLFAKEIGAKITAVTVTEPFPAHLASVASNELEYAP